MSDLASIKAVQQRMQQVRHDLGDEVDDLVESAKDMTDWRKYVRANPWVCVGVAAAVGFFIIPKRAPAARLDPSDLQALARHGNLKMTSSSSSGGLKKTVLSFLSSSALRLAMNYMQQRTARREAPADEHFQRH